MPTITLPDAYDLKLKELVTDPFEQTRESLIKDLIDAELERRDKSNGKIVLAAVDDTAIKLDPLNPGSLYHTKILSATIDGQELYRPKWNGIREHLHVMALKRLGSFAAMRAASGARVRPDNYSLEGYKFIPEGGFSIQGVDSNWCWDHALKLAKVLAVALRLRIEWRENEDAAYPGKTAILEWAPDSARP